MARWIKPIIYPAWLSERKGKKVYVFVTLVSIVAKVTKILGIHRIYLSNTWLYQTADKIEKLNWRKKKFLL